MPGSRAWRRKSTAKRPITVCTRRCGTSVCRTSPGIWCVGGSSPSARPTWRAHVGAARAVGRNDDGAAFAAGGHEMVTVAQVWDALSEIPDPEIPVISLVDLGVVRGIDVDDRRVRVEFTPTFLGCPALEVMRDAMADS